MLQFFFSLLSLFCFPGNTQGGGVGGFSTFGLGGKPIGDVTANPFGNTMGAPKGRCGLIAVIIGYLLTLANCLFNPLSSTLLSSFHRPVTCKCVNFWDMHTMNELAMM